MCKKEKVELTRPFHAFRTGPLWEAQKHTREMLKESSWEGSDGWAPLRAEPLRSCDWSTPWPDCPSPHCFPGRAWWTAAAHRYWLNEGMSSGTTGRRKWQLSDSEERTTESPSHFLSCSVSFHGGTVAKSFSSSGSRCNDIAKRRPSGSGVGGGGEEGRKWNSHLTFEFSAANPNIQLNDHTADSWYRGWSYSWYRGCISSLVLCNTPPLGWLKQQPLYLLTALLVGSFGWAQRSGSSAGLVWGGSCDCSSGSSAGVGWSKMASFTLSAGWCRLLADPLCSRELSSSKRLA